MSDQKKKLDLGRAVERGRIAGERLATRANPTIFASADHLAEARTQLEQVEARIGESSPLWEREWAALTIRSIGVMIGKGSQEPELRARCTSLRARLVELDQRAFGGLKQQLFAGQLSAGGLRAELAKLTPVEWDAFAHRLFEVEDVPERETQRPPGMVHYLPSPIASVLEIVDRIGKDEVFIDIGSGLGLVTALVALLSGARCKGVEHEPAYHRHAQALAARLPFLQLEPVLADCRTADYSEGSVFYVYDTIRDQLLETLIQRLAQEAEQRPIRIVSRGMSNAVFDKVAWLSLLETTPSGLSFYRSGNTTS